MTKKPEILAPASNLKKIKYAIAYGADAVYCGLPDFSLRARINDFTAKNLDEAITYVHDQGKKIYVTINIFAHNGHIERLPAHLEKLKNNLPDAIIISDPGILQIVRKALPKIEIHLSTQANCTNWKAAKFWYDQGIKRIILARELTLKEIKRIHKKVPKLKLECFVHGAMCMSYSGRCMLSKYFTGRSANLGDCTHPCRWKYNLFVEEKERPNIFLPVYEDDSGTYIFNSKDLCLIKYLDQLKKAGISCFKIEGRSKSIFYIALITKYYKLARDKKENAQKLFNEIKKMANRGFTTGFILGKDKYDLPANLSSEALAKEEALAAAGQKTDVAHMPLTYEFVGEIIDCFRGSTSDARGRASENIYILKIQVHNALYLNDQVEIIQPNGPNIKIKITKIINKKNNQQIKEAHGGAGQVILVPYNRKIQSMSVLRKKIDS